jgi:3-deoxy-D-manno-octulosonic-acid transferase
MLAHLVAFFSAKVANFLDARDGLFINLKANTQSWKGRRVAWFHVSSLGEFEQGRPAIEAFRNRYPTYKILLTFFSPSGYDLRKDYNQVDYVCYLPIDTPSNAEAFLEVVQPDIVFFVKYDFWYNFLTELKRRKIPVVLFSAIFRPNQAFFKWYGGLFREMLFCFNHILVQNQSSVQLLQSVNYQNVSIGGDTRFDRVAQLAAEAPQNSLVEDFKGTDLLLIAGSVWADDMAILIPFLNHFDQPLKVIIAPHQINAKEIDTWQKQLAKTSVKWSEIEKTESLNHSIIVLDCIGLLASLYRYADFAYIGGAFGDGLHSILEPATFGMPVFFGNKYYDKFQEANDLLELGGAQKIADTTNLTNVFEHLYQDKETRIKQAKIVKNYIQTHTGATQRLMAVVENFVNDY